MNALDRKLLRDLGRSKGLMLAIASIIAVGVMCFIYMRSSYHNLTRAKDSYYAQTRMADFWIDLKKAPLAELAAVADLPGVTGVRTCIRFLATAALDDVAKPLNGLVISAPDRREPMINDIVLKRGGYFTERRDDEVIVNDAFARAHRLRPGDRLHLLLNNRREELYIVGTAISSEFVYLLGPGAITPDPEHFGVFYIKRRYAEDVFDFQGAANEIVGTLAPQVRERPKETLRQAELLLAPYGVFSAVPLSEQASNRYLSDEIAGLGVFATIMPAIFLVVGGLVLNVLTKRLSEQQRTVIGTLKAFGYTDGQLFRHFMKFGAVIGVVGGLVGSVMGYGLAWYVTIIYRRFFEFPELVNRVYWSTYLIGMLISIVGAMIGSSAGARAALRLRPAEAMRPKPPPRGGAVLLERFDFVWRRLSFGWRMVLRNLVRHRGRTAVGVFAAMIGASLASAGFMMSAAMPYMIDFQFRMVARADVDLSFENERGADVLDELRHVPGVDLVEPILDVACTFENGSHARRGAITGLASDATLTIPRDAAGRPIRIPQSGLAMTRKMAELLHVGVGDMVTVRPVKGLRDPRPALVASINESYLGAAVYADVDYLNRLIHEEFSLSGAQLKINPRAEAKTLVYRRLKELPGLQSVNAREDMIENLEETFVESQSIVIGMITLFAGVIFFSSILNASLISLSEREREVATLRVLGYTDWQVGSLFLRESMIVDLVGAALGLPVGYLLVVWMSVAYDTDLFRFPVVWTPRVALVTLGLAIGFGLAAHAVVQRIIGRAAWRDALNVQE